MSEGQARVRYRPMTLEAAREQNQRSLFDTRDTRSVKEAFAEFHEANPHVYDEIVKLCRMVKAKGRDKWGARGIFEVLRWSRFQTHGDEYKLNNNYTPLYARMVMDREPDLAGFFDVRDHGKGAT